MAPRWSGVQRIRDDVRVVAVRRVHSEYNHRMLSTSFLVGPTAVAENQSNSWEPPQLPRTRKTGSRLQNVHNTARRRRLTKPCGAPVAMAVAPVRLLLHSFGFVSACEQRKEHATPHFLRLGLGQVVLPLTVPSSRGKLKKPDINDIYDGPHLSIKMITHDSRGRQATAVRLRTPFHDQAGYKRIFSQ